LKLFYFYAFSIGEPLVIGNVFFVVKLKRRKDTPREEAIEICSKPDGTADDIYSVKR